MILKSVITKFRNLEKKTFTNSETVLYFTNHWQVLSEFGLISIRQNQS